MAVQIDKISCIDFGIVLTVWYFLLFILLYNKINNILLSESRLKLHVHWVNVLCFYVSAVSV